MRVFLSVLLSALFWPTVLHAEETMRTPLTADVLWELQRVGAPVVSPDGVHVVVPATRYDGDSNDAETRLWLLNTAKETSQRALTMRGSTASAPAFSPDGKQLAFISKRDKDEAGQVYLLPMTEPGEAIRLTDVPTGVSGLRWVGEHLYFISSVWPNLSWAEMKDRLKTEAEDHVSASVWDEMPYAYFDHYLDQARQNHLFRIPAAGGDIEPITGPTGLSLMKAVAGASHYHVSPDRRQVAFVADSNYGGVYFNADVFLLEIGATSAINLTADNPAMDSAPQFSPDGSLLAFQRQRIQGFYGDQHKLMLHDLRRDTTTMLHEGWDRSASGLVWAPDSKGLYGAIDDEATSRLYFIPVGRGAPQAIGDKRYLSSLSMAGNGTLVALHQSFLYPNQVVLVGTDDGDLTRLDGFNDDLLANVDMGSYESVTFRGANGADVQMWVNYPPGFDRGQQYPLMMLIHGGPHNAITDSFHYRWNAQTFASWGYVTAWPNFHGSSGFGQEFVDAINPDWITKPYADVMAAAEFLAEKPFIDGERMVAAGGSYGGYLSSIILGKEHPFKALVIHAAVYDLYAQMASDSAINMERFGPYWENPDLYKEQSPHFYAANFNTPSLVIHGQRDLRVPVGQGFELYRTLQTRGVDSRLVYYPDENHWILKRGNSVHWYGQVRDWIKKYAEPGAQ